MKKDPSFFRSAKADGPSLRTALLLGGVALNVAFLVALHLGWVIP